MNIQALKERHKEIVVQLSAQLSSGETAALFGHLKAAHRLREYSVTNRLLIALQAPSASRVMSRTDWEKAGHTIAEGARAIYIYAPRVGKNTSEAEGGVQQALHVDKRAVFFQAVRVYQASDTLFEGAQVTPDTETTQPVLDNMLALGQLQRACPYPLRWDAVDQPQDDGTTLLIPSRAAGAGADAFHVLWAWAARLNAACSGDQEQAQAEALLTATVVAQSLGMNSLKTGAELYVKIWGGKPKRLKSSLARVLSVAQQIEDALREKGVNLGEALPAA